MLITYFKVAWRAFRKNRTVSLINVLGLAAGLVVTLLIGLYVAHEYSYDRFHVQGSRIAKVELRHDDGTQSYSVPTMSYRFGEAVKTACPGVEDFARITDPVFGTKLVQSDLEHKSFEAGFQFADPGFLRLFSFTLLKGDPKTALTQPATVVLTERMARKYFGDADPIGKTITYDKKHLMQVVGVIRNPPFNSSIQFDFLGDMSTYRAIDRNWHAGFLGDRKADEIQESVGTGGSYNTYFLLHPQASGSEIERKIPSLLSPGETITNPNDQYKLYALSDLHFSVIAPGQKSRVTVFSVIGGLILALALINYVNLTTARSTLRAKEVSIRKMIGAERIALIIQFYFESALYVTLAFGVAVLLFVTLQPFFFAVLHLNVDRVFLTSPFFLAPAVLVFLASIFVSGSYPALLLSRFSPMKVLKGRSRAAGSVGWIRRGLTVFQFTVSVALIIGSLLINNQLKLFLEKDLGIDRDRVVTVFLDPEDGLDKHFNAIREEIRQLKEIESVTASSLVMYDQYMNSWRLKRTDTGQAADLNTFDVDESFISTMSIPWAIPPRAREGELTKNRIVINETAAKQLGINAGNYEQTLDAGQGITKNVVGVVKDFNYSSLARGIKPMALFMADDSRPRNYLYLKLAKGVPTSTALVAIRRVYDRYKTEKPFAYAFLDETYRRLYDSEVSLQTIILALTGFAVLIACLGLFGLAAFVAEQRTKEIGIRKVMGASVGSVVRLLSADFLKLILLAVILASPVAWYVMHHWLENFTYKVTIEWWVFALAGGLAIGIALITVGFQSIRAALTNPVRSLRSE